MNREIKFEYGFISVNGLVKKVYHLHEIPNIQQKCDVWNVLPIKYVRQFVGHKDKNGVEIFEGDYDSDGNCVRWCQTCNGWEFSAIDITTDQPATFRRNPKTGISSNNPLLSSVKRTGAGILK